MKDIAKFAAEYDSSHEATAFRTRGVFINKFPRQSLAGLTLDEYVVGHCFLSEMRRTKSSGVGAMPELRLLSPGQSYGLPISRIIHRQRITKVIGGEVHACRFNVGRSMMYS